MRGLQSEIIRALNVRSSIDPEEEIERRVGFLAEAMAGAGARGLVLGISGGQDSSLAGRLCTLAARRARAAGADGRFVAVRLPYRTQQDEADARLAIAFIEPDESVVIDVAPGVDGLVEAYRAGTGERLRDFVKGNVKARMRMVAQYALAGQLGMLVVGTDHAAEAVTGFFTKHGDGAADLTPLAGLTKNQGARMLRALGAPDRLWLKTPTADLLDEAPGQADETDLGIGYRDIDAYLEGGEVDQAVAEAIEQRYLATAHKRRMPATPFDD